MFEPLAQLRTGLGLNRLPMVLQTEAAECGLACLAMVAAHHGHRIDLATLRQRFSVSLKGMTMADLVRIGGELQLQSRPLRAEMSHLAQLRTPCILHWDLNHFVVLASVGRDHAVIHDPARGVRKIALAELSRHFTGVVLELSPAADFSPRTEKQSVSLTQLLGQVSGLKRSLFQIFLLALALEAFLLLSPFFLQWVVDGALVSADRDLLVTLGIGFGGLVLLQVASGALRSWAVLHLSSTLNLQWMGNVFAHLLRLPVAWFEKRHAGDVMSRFGAVQKIQQTLTTSFIEALLDGLLVVVTLAVMWIYSPTLALIALAAVAVYALLRAAFYAPQKRATEEAIVHDAKSASHFLESLRGVTAIKLHNREADRQARFMNLVVDAMNAQLGARKLELAMGVLHKTLFGLERVAVVWVGALLVMDQQFSVGMLFAFLAYKEQFAQRCSALIDKAVELKMLRLQCERLADIVLAEPEPAALPSMVDATNRPPLGIEVEGMSFRYADGEPWVLKGCSFAIEPGESVAIVGASGCGKTTLMKLLLGVHAPSDGQIRVGGRVLGPAGMREWRDQVGTVMQDDPLFTGSIADNIGFFDPQPDMAWIEACARRAAVHDEIAALPMGYHTLVGDLGASLSGGQRQRILLARALYKQPQILLLDEATSALDVDRERQVNEAIRELSITRIVVAHRPETIASADRMIVLQGGRIEQDVRLLRAAAPAETAVPEAAPGEAPQAAVLH
ncbi:peptidase domain-containing ABC transporter [Rivibacter subsaxonicus]|uniref:Cyclolysin secretion/processing ATP-binding protein CyaB n=1 Tax=Rivibacter subsaxonicus TaxID=457575 RepID=A0A4Q7VW45_9BURK|nr:peptidase domain-containing ABC transporter [Rivibacter subsaxonicus]RZU00870.1 ATP-binding cassette subfamily B protein RaxB [Rivibacter subsaxonicus]